MNILIFCRHFPPLISGGSRRIHLLYSGLKELGANVQVIAPSLPPDVSGLAIPHPSPEPRNTDQLVTQKPLLQSTKDFSRRQFLLPDPDIKWCLRATRSVKNSTLEKPTWILSTSPCESVHIGAYLLAKHFNSKWIADFRDQWLIDPLICERNNILRKAAESCIASYLLKRANLVSGVTPENLYELQKYAPKTPQLLLPQSTPHYTQTELTHKNLNAVHTGSFSLSHDKRSIKPLLELFRRIRLHSPKATLNLFGRLSVEETQAAQNCDGTVVHGVVDRERSLTAQSKADILISIAAPQTKAQPGKLSEYAAMNRPILCVGGGKWATNLMLGYGTDVDAVFEVYKQFTDFNAKKAFIHSQSKLLDAMFDTPIQSAKKLLDKFSEISQEN